MQKFWTRIFIALPIAGIALVVFLVSSFVRELPAWATTTTIDTKMLNSYAVDSTSTVTDPVTGKFLILIGGKGSDGLWHALATDASGNIAAAGNLTPADGAANPTNASPSEAFNMWWNGATWDRAIDDASKNLLVSLGTQLDGVNDTVSIRINNVIQGLLTVGADATSNTFNGVQVNSYENLFNGTTWDRWRSYAGNADTITSPTLGLGGVAGYNLAYNGASWDRVRLLAAAGGLRTGYVDGSVGTGFGMPGTPVNVTATTNVCSASNAFTVGNYVWVQTDNYAHCRFVADNTGTAVSTDPDYFNPGLYQVYITDTSHDTICCVAASGTSIVQVTPVTFQTQ